MHLKLLILLFVVCYGLESRIYCNLSNNKFTFERDNQIQINPDCNIDIISASIIPQLPKGIILYKNGTISGKSEISPYRQEYTIKLQGENKLSIELHFSLSIKSPITQIKKLVNELSHAGKKAVRHTEEVTYANIVGEIGIEIEARSPSLSDGLTFAVSPDTPLPLGLDLNEHTGIISGTPAASFDGSITINVISSTETTATQVSIKIAGCMQPLNAIYLKYKVDIPDSKVMIVTSSGQVLYSRTNHLNTEYVYSECYIPSKTPLTLSIELPDKTEGYFTLIVNEMLNQHLVLSGKKTTIKRVFYTINNQPPKPFYSSQSITTYVGDNIYTTPFVHYGAISFEAVNLPSTFTFNKQTGEISGVLDSTISFQVIVTNPSGTATVDLSFTTSEDIPVPSPITPLPTECSENEYKVIVTMNSESESRRMRVTLFNIYGNIMYIYKGDEDFTTKQFNLCISNNKLTLHLSSDDGNAWDSTSSVIIEYEHVVNTKSFRYTGKSNPEIEEYTFYIGMYGEWQYSNIRQNDNSWNVGFNKGDWEEFTEGNYPEQTDVTTYYRRIFILYDNIAEFNNIFAKLFYVSGVIMYINGEVVFKKNLPETVAADTYGTEYDTKGYEFSLVLAIQLLHVGVNYISIELHKAETFDILTNKFEVSFTVEKGNDCIRCLSHSPLTCSAKNNQGESPNCDNLVDNNDETYNSFVHYYQGIFGGNKEYKPILFTMSYGENFECYANKYYYATGNENGKNINNWEFYFKNGNGDYELSDSVTNSGITQRYTLTEFPLSTSTTSHYNSFQWKITQGQQGTSIRTYGYIITSEFGLETCNPLGKSFNYCNDDYNGPSEENTVLTLQCKNGYEGTYQRTCGSNHEWSDNTDSCYLPDYDSTLNYGVDNLLKPIPNIKTEYQLLSGSGAISYSIFGEYASWLSFDDKTGTISVIPENTDTSFEVVIEAKRLNKIFKSTVKFEIKSLACDDGNGNSIPVNTITSYPCGDGFESNDSGKKIKCIAVDENTVKLSDADMSECKYLKPVLTYENNGVFVINAGDSVSIKPTSHENTIDFINCNNCNNIPSGLSFDITTGSISGKTTVAGKFELNIEYGNRDHTLSLTISITIRKAPTYLTYGVSDTISFYKGFKTSEYPTTDGIFDSFEFITNGNSDGKFTFDQNTGVITGDIKSASDDIKIIVAGKYEDNIIYVTVVAKIIEPTCPADSRYNNGNPGTIGTTYERECESPYKGTYSIYCPVEMNPVYETEVSHCHYYPTTFKYSSTSFIVFTGDETHIEPELDQGGESGTVIQLTQGNLPEGLSINEKTGVISGTTTDVGTFSFFITATYERSIKVGLTIVVVIPSCFADSVNGYEETKRNEIVSKSCGYGYSGNETRQCLNTNPPEWGEIDRSQCVLLNLNLEYGSDSYYAYLEEEFILEPTVKENLFTTLTCTEIPGLVFDSNTGILSGIPTTEGNYDVTIYAKNFVNEITINIKLIITHTRPTEINYNDICQFYYKFNDEYSPIFNQGYADSYTITPELLIEGLTFDKTTGKISGMPKVKSFEGSFQVNATYTGNYTLSNEFSIKVSHSYCSGNPNYNNTDAGDIASRDCLDNLWGNISITCSYDRLNPQYENEVSYCRPRYPYQFSYREEVYELKGAELIEPIFPVFEGQESTRFYISNNTLPSGLFLNDRTGKISGIPAEDVPTVRIVEIEARDERSMFANISFIIIMPKCPTDVENGYEETIAGKIVYKECGDGYSGIESRECSTGVNPKWGIINRAFCTYLLPNVGYGSSSFTLYQSEYVNITAIRDASVISKYDVTNLPIGLSINPQTFDISGIPSIPGHFQTIITLSNERDESKTIISFTILKERPKKMEYKDNLVFYTDTYSVYNITLEGGSVDYYSITPLITIPGIYLSAVNGSIYGKPEKGNKGEYRFTVNGNIASEKVSTEITITVNEPTCPALSGGIPETPKNTTYHLPCSDGLYGTIDYTCSDSNTPSWSSPINYCHELSPSKYEYNETAMFVYIGRETNLKPTFVGRADYTVFTIVKGELPEGLRIEQGGAIVGMMNSTEYFGKYITVTIQAEDDIIKVATLKLSITQVQCDKALYYGFDWPIANESTEIVFECPYGYSGTTKGKCVASLKDDKLAEWSNIEMNCDSEIPGIIYPESSVEFIVYYDDFYTPQLIGKVQEVKIIEGILPLGIELDPSTGELAVSAYVTSDPKTVKIVAVNGDYTSEVFSLTISVKMVYCPADNGFDSVPIGFQSTKLCSGDLEGVLIRDCPIEKENPTFGDEYGECKQPIPSLIYLDSYYQVIINYANVSIKPYKLTGNPISITISPEELPNGMKFDSKEALIYGIPTEKKNQEYTITAKNENGESSVKITIDSTVTSCPQDGLWPETPINNYGYIKCSGKNQKYHIQRSCDEVIPTPDPPYGEWNHISTSYCVSSSKILGSSVDKTLIVLPFTFIEPVDLFNSKSYLGLVKGIQSVITTSDTIILLDSVRPKGSKSRLLEGSNYIYAYIYTLKPTSVQLTISNKKDEIIQSIKNNDYTDEYKSQVFAIESIEIINPNPNESRNVVVDNPSVSNSEVNSKINTNSGSKSKKNESVVVCISIGMIIMMILVLM